LKKLFIKKLKNIHEYQSGVPLSYCDYPITQRKTDNPKEKPNKNKRWRFIKDRQPFCKTGEQGGSFCLGTARGMAFRSVFGLELPTYRRVLMDLKDRIEKAKKDKDLIKEAKALISRIVSHQHRTGPIEQFNEDLESRYGLKNVKIKEASRREALDALKAGAPILVDLPPRGWHWVLVHRSPQGELWQNDPLPSGGVKRIKTSEFGSRFEIIVDANTGKPITPDQASNYKK
jgi:hypothetical protein